MGEEYGVGKEEEVSVNESECVLCDGQSRGSVSEQDTEGDTDTSSGPIVPVTAAPGSSDVQPHTAAGSKDMSHNGPDTRAEPLDKENRDGTEGLEIGSEGFQPGHSSSQPESDNSQVSAQQPACDEDSDAEIARRAREEGRVDVIFQGSVTQDGCCRFVCELLKCILYQRQQLPMTYDQMVFFQKQQLATTQLEEAAARKSIKPSGDSTWQRCHRSLRDMDEVLGHLEMLFSLSYVPRILFILGSSTNLPTELYEINMEALVQGGSDRSLRTSQCLRRLFRTLFVADLLSDVKPVRLMGTTVMALAHRDCGVEWFKPKVDFRVPTRVKRQVISLASDASGSDQRKVDTTDWDDYIWFQTPVAIKGFCK